MKNVLVEICVYVAESSHNADTDMQLFKFWHILKKKKHVFLAWKNLPSSYFACVRNIGANTCICANNSKDIVR